MQTQYAIMYEKGRLTSYSAGQTVMKIHHRSPWNENTEILYRVNKVIGEKAVNTLTYDKTSRYHGIKQRQAVNALVTLQVQDMEYARKQNELENES
jgi:hypothetical protein